MEFCIRALLDALTGPSSEEVEHIVRLIRSSSTWEAANRKIRPLGLMFTLDNPDLNSTGAIGGYDGELDMVALNAARFPIPEAYLFTVIEHELTHRDQMARAKERGGDPEKICQQKMDQFVHNGRIDMEKYGRDPLEMQALARNAVSNAKRKGKDPKRLMRAGMLAQHAPMPALDRNRFHKYAYQMAEDLLGSI